MSEDAPQYSGFRVLRKRIPLCLWTCWGLDQRRRRLAVQIPCNRCIFRRIDQLICCQELLGYQAQHFILSTVLDWIPASLLIQLHRIMNSTLDFWKTEFPSPPLSSPVEPGVLLSESMLIRLFILSFGHIYFLELSPKYACTAVSDLEGTLLLEELIACGWSI
jgi:hypothetical protein